MRWKKILGVSAAFLVLAAGAGFIFAGLPSLRIATGYYAKVMASAVFLAGRNEAGVAAQDLGFLNAIVSAEIDHAAKTVRATAFGLAASKAVYREGLGATLVHEMEEAVRRQPLPEPLTAPADFATLPWPEGNAPGVATPAEGVNLEALNAAVDFAFPDDAAQRKLWNTRAVVVVHDGRLIAERYAEGFSADSRLAGWSMTKSVVNALIGILVKQGRIDIHQPVKAPNWANDGRARITVDHLLRMSSGLEFAEQYFNPFADTTNMLFASTSSYESAAAKPLQYALDAHWSYASGTTNILSWLVRHATGEEEYINFPNRELFAPLGMYSAILEPDASGTFVGSSFGWATARDWARFGELYRNDGVWRGKRILPEGWVAYSTSPTPAAPRGEYGAHWWLNAGNKDNPAGRTLPSCPASVYFASGFEGQRIFVSPDHKAVVVRLGLTQKSGVFPWDDFLIGVLKALPESGK
jgi:CubicO group peptidase (beta-lactamase class C family)